MTTEDDFTRVERRLVDLRSDDEVDQADVEELLGSSDPVDKRAGLKALVLTATGEYDCFEDEVPPLTPYLTDADPNVRYNALQAAIELLPARAKLVDDAPAIVDLLDDDSDRVADKALDAVSVVARQDVAAVTDATPEVAASLGADRSEIRTRAVRFFSILVQEDPADAIPAIDGLVERVGDTYEMPDLDGDDWTTPLAHGQTRQDIVSHGHEERERHMTIREFAAEILITVARERPDEVRSHTDALRGYLTHDEPHVRRQALRVFTALGDERPAVVVAVSDEITASLDPDGPDELVAAAVKALGIAASDAPDRVAPDLLDRVGLLMALLDSEDPHVRGSAVGLLSHVADRDPSAVEPAEDDVIDLLDDEHSFVRGNAAWLLGSLGTNAAASALRNRRDVEPNQDVQDSIDHALETLGPKDESD